MQIAMSTQRRFWLFAIALGCAGLLACGSDDDDKEADAGEECAQAGQNQTNCICSPEQPPGSRRCRDDFTWSKCSCPPPVQPECVKPGASVMCPPCPGETVGHKTMCLQGNTFDCGCD
jgi:hypothetical protein